MTITTRHPLTIRAEHRPSCTILYLDGELDIATAPRLREQISARWGRPDSPCLVIDLARVQFCDSSGLAVLSDALRRTRATDERLILTALPQRFKRLLGITGLYEHFEQRTTADQAARDLTTPP
jgi:anti-anti-sigma factor